MDILSMSHIASDEGLKEKTFMLLVKLMGFRNQLRMNHWQTEVYSEHKLTDDILEAFDEKIDEIGEVALGLFERPQINTVSINISDIRVASTRFVLDQVDQEICSLLEEFKVTSFESMISVLGDFSAEIKKFKYLSTFLK